MKPIFAMLLCLLGLIVGPAAKAQPWPAKPLHVIVPVGAGSLADILARLVFESLSPRLGQTILVEDRTGAGGTVGAAFVAKSNSDGYTLLVHSNAHTIAPALYAKLAYDPARDFSAVIPLGTSPHVLVVSPAKGFRTVRDLVTAGKAKPGALTFASVGVGTATHLSAERFLASARMQAVHVPFRGGAQALTEVMTGRVDFFFGPAGLVLPYIRDGKLLALAVNDVHRSAALPDVPTTSEAGFANAEYPIWFGVFAPAKTPREIVNKLNREIVNELQTAHLRKRLAQLAIDPMTMTPAEFDAFVANEVKLNAVLAKKAGLTPQ